MRLKYRCAKLHLCIAVLLIAGCAPKAVKVARDKAKVTHEIQTPITVRTSRDDNRPDWTKQTSFEEDGKVYFTGWFLNGSDYALSIRCANAEALKVAVQSIPQFIPRWPLQNAPPVAGSKCPTPATDFNVLMLRGKVHTISFFILVFGCVLR